MKSKAFTLIELLIVVAIIAILAAIAVPNFLEAQTRSKVTRTVGEARTIAVGLEAYMVDNRDYPPDGSGYAGVSFPTFALRASDVYYAGRYLTTPIAYISQIPIDVFNAAARPVTGFAPPDPRVSQFYSCKKYTTNNGTLTTGRAIPWSLDANKPFSAKVQTSTWMLWNIGPSHNYGTNAQGDSCWIIPYDPTNGTVSNGGIWRLSSGPMF